MKDFCFVFTSPAAGLEGTTSSGCQPVNWCQERLSITVFAACSIMGLRLI